MRLALVGSMLILGAAACTKKTVVDQRTKDPVVARETGTGTGTDSGPGTGTGTDSGTGNRVPPPAPGPVPVPGPVPAPAPGPVPVPAPEPVAGPSLPTGELSLSKINCPGGAEIPASPVTFKNLGGVVTLSGNDELRSRLLGGAPSLALETKDGVLLVTSTEPLPGYCGGLKPFTLVFTASVATPSVCAKLWKPDARAAADDPKVFENELRWEAQKLKKGETRALAHAAELQGDFVVRVEFRNFAPGGRGANFRARLEDLDAPKHFAFAMIGNNSEGAGLGPMLMTAIVDDGAFDEAGDATAGSRSQPAGAFTFAKTAKLLVVTAETVDGRVERRTTDAAPFTDGRYRLKLEAGNNSTLASLANPTGIAFTKVTVRDKNGAELSGSDAFVCDSLGD